MPAANCQLHTIFAPMKILMVCLGNLCRSPLAEGVLKNKILKAGLDWTVESAGTNGYHNGEPPHPLSQKVARMHGIDICDQRSRRLVPEDFDKFDKIYALAEDVLFDIKQIAKKKFNASKVDLLMNELYPGKDLDVPDPWAGPEEEYHEAFKLIDAACEKIIEKALRGSRFKGQEISNK
jgi:protein-tyrosine phosphatase